ncbi:MAG TPA: hypothetical protein VGH20_14210 [Myxococcales bacterium]|jgi:hypothetical protein
MTRKRSHESPLERKATQHHDFIGEASQERAKAEEVKREHLEKEREQEVVREMAAKLDEVAAKPELRVPRSVEEGKRLLAEGPQILREKAQERLDNLPKPLNVAVELAQIAGTVALVPFRLGLRVVRGAVTFPAALFHALRRQEA